MGVSIQYDVKVFPYFTYSEDLRLDNVKSLRAFYLSLKANKIKELPILLNDLIRNQIDSVIVESARIVLTDSENGYVYRANLNPNGLEFPESNNIDYTPSPGQTITGDAKTVSEAIAALENYILNNSSGGGTGFPMYEPMSASFNVSSDMVGRAVNITTVGNNTDDIIVTLGFATLLNGIVPGNEIEFINTSNQNVHIRSIDNFNCRVIAPIGNGPYLVHSNGYIKAKLLEASLEGYLTATWILTGDFDV